MSSIPAASASPPLGGFRRFWRALKQLLHEVAGAVFGVLALMWVNLAVRAWMRDAARWTIYAAAALAALFVLFSWTSFRSARRL